MLEKNLLLVNSVIDVFLNSIRHAARISNYQKKERSQGKVSTIAELEERMVILDNLTVVVSQIVIKDTGLDTVLHATFFHLPYRYLKRSVTGHLQVIGQWSIVKDGTTPQNC